MAVTVALPSDIIDAICTQLATDLTVTRGEDLIVSDDPDASGGQGNVWYVLAPSPKGTFDASHFDGGGQNTLGTEVIFTITVHVSNMQDIPNQAEEFYMDSAEGIWSLAKNVLKSMAGFEPDNAGAQLLHQPIFPVDFATEREGDKGSIQLGFKIIFDWDVT